MRATSLALVAAVSILVAGCSSQPNHGTAAIPRTTPPAAAATRTFLSGPGSGLLHMNSIASTLTRSTPVAICRSDSAALVGIASESSSNGQVTDQQLAELLADEESALAAALADCSARSSNSAAVDKLGIIHSAVNSRLQSDGVRS